MIDPSVIQDKADKFCRQSLAFERLWYFGVIKNDPAGKAAIGEQRAQAIDLYFESLGLFIVGDVYVVEIHLHGSPGGLAGFFGFVHEDLQMARKVYQGISQN